MDSNNNNTEVGQATPGQISAVTSLNKAYYGNPNANFKGQDSGESFAFINFYDTTGTFNKVTFTEVNNGGGYESDNQTVGLYTSVGAGSPIVEAPRPLLGASPWALAIIAAGCVAARRRSPKASVEMA